jgi:hypothetical protein
MHVATVGTMDMSAPGALDPVGQPHVVGTGHTSMTEADLVIRVHVAELN